MTTYLRELFSLEGRVAFVTGASSGIGRHMAGVLARGGASVVLVARRADALHEAVDELKASGLEACAQTADLSDRDGLVSVYATAAKPFGPPDILVNAAGVNFREPADEISPKSWDKTLMLNLSVPFFLGRLCMPAMKNIGAGNIINIASLQSFRAFENGLAYGASKGGIAQLTRAMAEAWSQHGIVTNAIAPGFFPTELTAEVFGHDAISGMHASRTMIGRNGEMRDLDGATIFLASGACRYVTGQIIPVDGGYTAK